tara:strand:- start:13561 stop:15276 length:1716 start_codon:yes stop_codon:yes gene_type:complete
MATVIQIKRSSATSAPSTLKQGELGLTYGTGTVSNLGDRLFIGTGSVDLNGDATSIDVIGGKYFADLNDHAHGSLTANSTLIVDNNKAIDEFIVGNSATIGGTIKLNEGTNNGSNFIAIKSPNDVSATTTFVLPNGDGSAGQFLKTDGSGNLGFETVFQNIDMAGDTGTDQYNTNETLTFAGGTGIDSAITDNTVTFNITNSGVDTNQIADDAVTNAKLSTNGETILGNSTLTLGSTTTDIGGLTSLVVDDITINGQTLQTTSANKDININPHGTGTVKVPSGYEDRSGFDNQSLVNKSYVDQVAQGLDTKPSCRAGTTADLSATYSNGSSGVGATLTATSNGAIVLDGVSPIVNDRILVKDQTDASENGIYVVSTQGNGSTAFVLTRATPEDQPSELSGGAFVFVEEGSANANNGYTFTHTGAPTFGTTDLDVAQFSGAGQITAGAALSKAGNTLDVEVDGSSIEVATDALRVKALGITNAMLAGSIASSKLADPIYFTDETSTQGQVSVGGTLEFLAGEGMNTTANGNTLTITGELASNSNIGVAKFSSDNFGVTSGDVEITLIDGGSF